MMDKGTATITVARRAPNDVKVRQIYISLDGKRVAELLYGDTFTLQVEPGEHWLRANNTLVWKTLDCKLAPGEHAPEECGKRGKRDNGEGEAVDQHARAAGCAGPGAGGSAVRAVREGGMAA